MTTSTVEPLGDYVLTLACLDQPGIVHAVTTFLIEHGGNIRESQQFGDRESGRFFMRIDFETAQATDAETLRPEFAATAERFAMTLRPVGRPGAVPHVDHGLQAAALPQRPAVPHDDGRPPDRGAAGDLQPSRRRGDGAVLRHRLPARAGHARHQGRGRGRAAAPRSTSWASTWSCWRATCRSCPTTCAAAERPGDQHPPLVPAQLQGRQALPPGPRPGREAGRRHGALRHRRPRRGPDHRAGRDPRRPHPRRRPAGRRRAATSRPRCSPGRSAGTPRPGSCPTAAVRWCSARSRSVVACRGTCRAMRNS